MSRFAGGVVVDQGDVNTSLCGDRSHRGPVESDLGEESPRGIDDVSACVPAT
jgi:hypothetical protein